MKKIFLINILRLLLVVLSTSLFGFSIKPLEPNNPLQSELVLSAEKALFIEAFLQAYAKIPLKQLHIKSLHPFLEEAFEDELVDFRSKKENVFYYNALDKDKKVVGYVSFNVNPKENTAYIRQLAVSPKVWKKGLGKKLVFAILKDAPVTNLRLVTRKVNKIGIEFYQHIGFKKSNYKHKGRNPDLYIGYEWHSSFVVKIKSFLYNFFIKIYKSFK